MNAETVKKPEELNALNKEVLSKNGIDAMFTEENLQQIHGGSKFGQGRDCKYCGMQTTQQNIGVDYGWEVFGDIHECELWLCLSCWNTNSYDVETGELI